MGKPGTQLQIALALVSAVAALTVGVDGPHAAVITMTACAAAAVWVLRALNADRLPEWADLTLLAVMLIGSAVTAIPTGSTAVQPMAGSIVIVVGSASYPRWTVWVWPAMAAVAGAAGAIFTSSWSATIVTLVILALAVVAGSARRAVHKATSRELQHLRREHAIELERIRVAAERVLTPERLQERYPSLTPREAEVLVFLAHGDSNAEIATRMFISVATVKSHVNAIFSKIPARDRAQAIALTLGTASLDQRPVGGASNKASPASARRRE